MSLRPSQLRASAAEAAMMIPEAARLRRDQRTLRMPVVIVAGEKDRLLDTSWHSKRLHERLPHSTLRVVPGAGHMVHHTATEAVIGAIDEAAALSRGTPAAVWPESAERRVRELARST
jgi:pimeloyl-ACP methyl ester carboxylesterase